MSFRELYESPWHNPLAFWLAGGAFAIFLASRLPFLTGWFVVFLVEILADAAQSAMQGHLAIPDAAKAPLGILFVILGDFRWLLLGARYAGRPRPWLLAIGIALVVPVATLVAMRAAPVFFAVQTRFFLAYELSFLLLAIGWQKLVVERASLEPDVRRWLGFLFTLELAQYALWATADVLLLRGIEVGWAIRLIPNFLYYAAFLPFAFVTAPRRLLLA